MTELDLELPELAAELIDEFGTEVAYSIFGEAVYNTATAKSVAPETPVPGVKAVVEDYSLQGSGQAFAAGLVESGDKKLTTAAVYFTTEPTPGDKFGFDGKLYTVLNVKTVYSGQLPCLYEIQGRA